MHISSFRTFLSSILLTSLLASVTSFPIASAATGDLVVYRGSVTVEQQSPISTIGSWTLLHTSGKQAKGTLIKETASALPPGSYTLFIEQPKGFGVSVKLFDGTSLVKSADNPQLTFVLTEEKPLSIVVHYSLLYSGKLSITSNPNGIPFELRGPNQGITTGVTPESYEIMPIGQYSVRYLPNGCTATPPRSDELVKDGRVDFSVTIRCDKLKIENDTRQEEKDFVSTVINSKVVIMKDVPLEAWFATYVSSVSRRGILTGYKDSRGIPTGVFGPQNPVTLAELAKIAHELTGLNEKEIGHGPRNPLAVGEWSSRYIASAEDRDWLIYTDPSVNLNRPATRGEVLVTLLQALDISAKWPKGTMFKDVSRRTPYSGAIETAAEDGIVSGLTDASGISTGNFGPSQPINRAEMSKILIKAMDIYRLNISEDSGSSSSSN